MEFISLQEAADLTGKNIMTIRRLTKKPGSKTYAKLDMAENKWYIDKGYLFTKYPSIQPIHTETIHDTGQPLQNDKAEPIQEVKADNYINVQDIIQNVEVLYKQRVQGLEDQLADMRKTKEAHEKTISDQSETIKMQSFNIQSLIKENQMLLQAKQEPEDQNRNIPPESEQSEPLKRKRWWQW